MDACWKYVGNRAGEIWFAALSEIQLKKWLGEIGGAGGQTGGWESKGRRGQVKFLKMFPDGRIWRYWMTLPNSVELFTVEFFLAEKLTSKVKIPLFWGFVLPTHFQKQVGWGTWLIISNPEMIWEHRRKGWLMVSLYRSQPAMIIATVVHVADHQVRYQILINWEINQLIRDLLRSFRIAHLRIEWTKVDLY